MNINKILIVFVFCFLYCVVISHAQVTQEWVRWGTQGSGKAIRMDSFNNIYVAGNGYDTVNNYIEIIKYSSSGVQQWLRKYNFPALNNFLDLRGMAVDSIGNCYIVGQQGPIGTYCRRNSINYFSKNHL